MSPTGAGRGIISVALVWMTCGVNFREPYQLVGAGFVMAVGLTVLVVGALERRLCGCDQGKPADG